MKKRVKFLLSTVMGCVVAAASAATVSVDPVNGVDEPSASAYKTLTYALAQHGGDTIYNLAAGTYSADSGETFPITLSGLANVAIVGLESGRGAVLDGTGTTKGVMSFENCQNPKISGLTVTGGQYVTATSEMYVSIVQMKDCSNAVVSDCDFYGNKIGKTGNSNKEVWAGALLFRTVTGVTLEKTLVRDTEHEGNQWGTSYGVGAMFENCTDVVIRHSEFTDNRCVVAAQNGLYGAGLCLTGGSGSTAVVTNCLFARNSIVSPGATVGKGAAIALVGKTVPTLEATGCTFDGNVGQTVYKSAGTPAFTDCVFVNNVNGGTIPGTLTNCRYDLEDPTIGYHAQWPAPVVAEDVYVSTSGDDANDGLTPQKAVRTITHAVTLASAGTTIHVEAGTYNAAGGEVLPIDLSGHSGLSIVGEGTGGAIVDGSGLTRLFTMTSVSGVLFKNLTLSGALFGERAAVRTMYGGAIYAAASVLKLENCRICDNLGGGNFNISAAKTMYGCGIYMAGNGAVLTAVDCVFDNNQFYVDGRDNLGCAINLSASASSFFTNTVFTANGILHEGGYGGAAYLSGGTHEFYNCLFADNHDTYGAALATASSPTIRAIKCTFGRNVGAAVYPANFAGITYTDCILWGNGREPTGGTAVNTVVRGGLVSGSTDLDPVFTNGYRVASAEVQAMGCGYTYPAAAETEAHRYWVDPENGSDENAGDEEHPLKTLTAALEKGGEMTVNLAEGTYDTASGETFPISLRARTAIRLVGAGADKTVLDATGSGKAVFSASNVVGLAVSGIGFTGGTEILPFNGGIAWASGVKLDRVADASFTDCAVYGNQTSRGSSSGSNKNIYGGGLFISNCGEVNFVRCDIRENTIGNQPNGSTYGIAFYVTLCEAINIRHSRIVGNAHPGMGVCAGGGIYCTGKNHETLEIFDTLIAGNSTKNSSGGAGTGAGIQISTVAATVRNCTIAENIGEGVNGAASLTVENSILYGNTDDVAGSPTLNYCDIGDGDAGAGCFSADPRFVGSSFLLEAESPCIDKGNVLAESVGLGEPYTVRADGVYDTGIVDLGYHQRDVLPPEVISNLFVSVTGSDDNKGTTREAPLRTLTKALSLIDKNVTVFVESGVYDAAGGEVFPLVLASTRGIEFVRTGEGEVVVDATGASNRAMKLDSVVGAKFDGFVFRGGYETVDGSGGGLYVIGCTGVVFDNCIVSNCFVDVESANQTSGGGMRIQGSEAFLTNCMICANGLKYAQRTLGGAIAVAGMSSVDMQRCRITDNVCGFAYHEHKGGAIFVERNCHLTLVNSLLTGNTTTGDNVGAVLCETYVDPYKNVYYGYAEVINCTLTENSSPAIEGPGANLVNTIVWANGATETNLIGQVDHSLIGVDPRFRRPAKGDYRLRGSSPCIDTGLNADWMKSAVDLKGDPRIRCGIVDMGCYECPASGLMLMVR